MNDNNKQNYFKQVKKCLIIMMTLNKSKMLIIMQTFERVVISLTLNKSKILIIMLTLNKSKNVDY